MSKPRLSVTVVAAAAACLGLVGVGTSGAASSSTPRAASAATGTPRGPVFEHGMAQPVFSSAPAGWVRQELWVTTRVDSDGDGRRDRVHFDVTRPAETRTRGVRVPVIYEATPYYSGIRDVANHDVDVPLYAPAPASTAGPGPAAGVVSHAYERAWVPRGFAVVHAESLGTGGSTGCPTSGGRNETLGARAVVDWLNGRAVARNRAGRVVRATWTTGRVGMIGTSYNGTLANAVATTGVEGLEAVVSSSAISSWYDYYRAGGAVVAPGGFQGEDTDVLARAVLTRAGRSVCAPVLRELARRQDRRTGDHSGFWSRRDYVPAVRRVRAAVLVSHGVRDWNVKTGQTARWYTALRRAGVPHKVYWHQGGHGGMPPARLLNRWFSHHLYGVANGVARAPHAYLRRPGGRLVTEREWPAPGTRAAVLRLRPRGDAARGGLTTLRTRPAVERIVDTPRLTAERLVAAPRSRHGRLYVTPALRRPVRLSGTAVAGLRLSLGQSAANVSVSVVDLTRRARLARVVTRGWRDPQNRNRIGVTQPVVPGRVYDLRVPTQGTDHVFPAGHRIGLVLTSTDARFTLRPPAGSTLALRTHRSALRLPVVGGAAALRRALVGVH